MVVAVREGVVNVALVAIGLPPVGAVYQLNVAPDVAEDALKVNVPGPHRAAPVPDATGPAFTVAMTGTLAPSQPVIILQL